MQEALAFDPSMFHNMEACPNPSNGTFKVCLESGGSALVPLQLFDATGRLVQTEEVLLKPGNNTIEINANLRAGLYLVKLGEAIIRIVIQ